MNIKPGSAYNKLKVKFAQGGDLPDDKPKSKTYTNKAEYDKALQAYNDSLNLYNFGVNSAAKLYKSTIDEYTEYTNNPDKKASDSLHNLTKLNTVKPKPIKTFTRNIVEGDRSAEAQASWFKKPVVKPEYKQGQSTSTNSGFTNSPTPYGERLVEIPEGKKESDYSIQTYINPVSGNNDWTYVPYVKGTLEQEVKPTMAKGTMESEPKPISELMMPSGNYMQKDDFIKRYGEKPWLKATGQKFANGGTFDTMNKDGTYGVQEKPEANTSWTAGVSMAGNMIQGTQDFSKSPNASMYKTEDAVWDTVGQLGPQGALIGGITDMMNTALRPIRESNDKKAGTSGYNEGLTIAGGLLNPLAALQTRGKYEGGYTDITGEGYEKYMAGLNRRAKFRENIGDFDANMNANINQISYLNSSPTFAKGGNLNIKDSRTVNQYGEPLDPTKRKNPNNVNKQVVENLVKGSYDRNLNPFTTLAIGLQETNLGQAKGVYGENLDKNPLHYNGSKTFLDNNALNESLDFLKEKNKYATKLGKTGDADKIQAWNGYGKLREAYDISLYSPENEQKFYGKSLKGNPIDFNKTPVYGDAVVNLRDSVIQQNPELVNIANKYAPSENKRIVGGQSQPMEYTDGGLMFAQGGQMTTEYKTGGTHEQNPNGGIPIGNSLMEEGEIRFDYLENKQPKSYIFSNRIKYKK